MKESLIHVVLLADRRDEYDFKYVKHYNSDVIDDDLKCLRYIDIKDVRSYDEIQYDEYTVDDSEIYKIRFNEIKSSYKLIISELLDYHDDLIDKLPSQEADAIFDNLLIFHLPKVDINEYSNIKRRLLRNSQIEDVLDVEKTSKIDIDFVEFYIKKKYSQKLEEYYGVNKSVSSTWRNKSFPNRRLKEFLYREGTLDIIDLFNRIYK